MSEKVPQNPVYAVAASSLEACLPKTLCAGCGTVLILKVRAENQRLKCCCCGTFLEAREEGGAWRTSVVAG